MAPEQVRGQHVDSRCDVWASGVVAWELIAGRRLYASSGDEIGTLFRIATEIPPRLSSVCHDVPASVDEAVAHALTPDLAGRTPTAAAFARELGHALRGSPMDSPSGCAPSTYTVVLGPGETKSLSVRASTSSPVAPAEPLPEHATSSAGRKLGVGLVAGGGVLLAGGIVTGLMALSDKSTVAKFCGPTSCTTQAGVDAASQGRVVSILSTVGFIGGLAALGGGVALIVGSPGRSASASITPQVSSAGGGLECAVAF